MLVRASDMLPRGLADKTQGCQVTNLHTILIVRYLYFLDWFILSLTIPAMSSGCFDVHILRFCARSSFCPFHHFVKRTFLLQAEIITSLNTPIFSLTSWGNISLSTHIMAFSVYKWSINKLDKGASTITVYERHIQSAYPVSNNNDLWLHFF